MKPIKVMKESLITVFIILFSSLTIAGDRYSVTGNMLMEWVNDSNNTTPNWSSGMVAGFVAGVSDSTSESLCIPSNVTNNQLEAIVTKYLIANPEIWNIPASDIVVKALSNVWKCKENLMLE